MDRKIPRHIAIIMDGNGRWAKAQGLPRTGGYDPHDRGGMQPFAGGGAYPVCVFHRKLETSPG